jgi:hypothetical protein
MNWKRPFRKTIELKRRRVAECPKCGAAVTDPWESGPARPQPGAFTVCWQCEEVLRFARERLELRQLSDDDRRTLELNPATRWQLEELKNTIAISRKVRAIS